MSTAYLWLKALHVITVAVWLGGALTLMTVTTFLSPRIDQQKLAAIAEVCDFIGSRVLANATIGTIVTGLLTLWVGHVHMELWVWWGIVSALLVLAIGAGILRLAFRRLVELLNEPKLQTAVLEAVTRRVRMFGVCVVILLVTSVVVMVLKPTL